MQNKIVAFEHLQKIAYKTAWDYQEKLLNSIVEIKLANRQAQVQQLKPTPNYLLFCQHNPVYTLGKSGKQDHLLMSNEGLIQEGIEFFKTNRGGDITYHGPGQIVGYPIIDLENFYTDLGKYLRTLEQVIINTLAQYGLNGYRVEGATGVWVGNPNELPRKICAMGVRASRWVTMHGWALNVNTNLAYFNHIVPCGITDKGVTSLEKELGREVEIAEVEQHLKNHFAQLFDFTLIENNSEVFE